MVASATCCSAAVSRSLVPKTTQPQRSHAPFVGPLQGKTCPVPASCQTLVTARLIAVSRSGRSTILWTRDGVLRRSSGITKRRQPPLECRSIAMIWPNSSARKSSSGNWNDWVCAAGVWVRSRPSSWSQVTIAPKSSNLSRMLHLLMEPILCVRNLVSSSMLFQSITLHML